MLGICVHSSLHHANQYFFPNSLCPDSCLRMKALPQHVNAQQYSRTRSAGVFDGHGFNGRSAATYARKNITKWLSVDGNAASKDPKRRLKALESVCGQIDRGLARVELCSFDASSSGLTACFGILQGNQICLATLGMHSFSAVCDVQAVTAGMIKSQEDLSSSMLSSGHSLSMLPHQGFLNSLPCQHVKLLLLLLLLLLLSELLLLHVGPLSL